jgi:hypothetical protein
VNTTAFTPPSLWFNHAWSGAGTFTITEDCYAAGMALLGPLAWANITSLVTVYPKTVTGIDVYEVRATLYPGDIGGKSGVGPGVPGRPYDPQAYVQLEAYVEYNGAPVFEKIVSFQINVTQAEYPLLGQQGACILYATAETNGSGYVDIYFRIPTLSQGYNGPTALFGKWTVWADVSICQVTYSDNMTFQVGYILTLSNMVLTSSPNKRMLPITFNVTVTNIDWISVPATMILVVYDNNEVPIGQALMVISDVPGEVTPLVSKSTVYSIGLTVPEYAYVGSGIADINLFTGLPALGGLAFCPQASAGFYITYP